MRYQGLIRSSAFITGGIGQQKRLGLKQAVLGLAFAWSFSGLAGAQIFSDFDGVGDETFQITANRGAAQFTWDNATGTFTWNALAAGNNRTGAVISTTTVDATAGPITGRVILTSGDNPPIANGIFIGMQDFTDPGGPGLWNNLSPAFGLRINPNDNIQMVFSDVAGVDDNFAPFGTATDASILDGFEVNFTLNATGWDFTISDIDAGGGVTSLNNTGNWTDAEPTVAGVDYSLFSTGNASHSSFSYQCSNVVDGTSFDLALIDVGVATSSVSDWRER